MRYPFFAATSNYTPSEDTIPMRIPHAADSAAIPAVASLSTVPAVHPPEERRTALVNFVRHAEAFAETRTVIGPVLDRLSPV